MTAARTRCSRILPAIESLTSQKHVVYYDGPVPFGDQAWHRVRPASARTTREASRASPSSGWPRCAAETSARAELNAAVAVHELIHGLGSLQGGDAPNECAPQRRPRLRLDDGRPLSVGEQPDDDLRADTRHGRGTTTTATRSRGSTSRTRAGSPTAPAASLRDHPDAGPCTASFGSSLRRRSSAPDRARSISTRASLPRSWRHPGREHASCAGLARAPAVALLRDARRGAHVTAIFGAATFRLTTSVGGKGKVSSTPGGVSCPAAAPRLQADSSIRLRAAASPASASRAGRGAVAEPGRASSS